MLPVVPRRRLSALALLCLLACSRPLFSAQPAPPEAPQKIIFDTDIGDDIDDAFALALLLSSPQVDLLGVTTDYGRTDLRARLVEGFLCETGNGGIPIAAGPETPAKAPLSQARWASRFPPEPWPDAVDFILSAIRKNSGEITLISVSPFTNLGALIDRDPAAFRQLKRVVIMGGSIHRGYGDLGYLPDHGPDAEYNIAMDIPAAQKLFASGVPLYVMPLDSTQLKLDEVKRDILFSASKPLTDALTLLYHQWSAATKNRTPTLYDAMAVAFALQPDLCPTEAMHIVVDDKGYTRVAPGTANAQVCLNSSPDRFFDFYMHRVLNEKPRPAASARPCMQATAP